MTPNPIRSLPSNAVMSNNAGCQNMPGMEHHMVSKKLDNGDTSVGYIEICTKCSWIDEMSLQWWVDDAIKQNLNARAKRIAVAAETEPFQFVQQRGEDLTLEEILFQALGAASVCWAEKDLMAAGEFNSNRAKAISVALMQEMQRALGEALGPWQELSSELYSLILNSAPLDPTEAAEWSAARSRIESRIQEMTQHYKSQNVSAAPVS